MPHPVQQHLSILRIVNLDDSTIEDALPQGWISYASLIKESAQITNVKSQLSLEIRNGVLYVKNLGDKSDIFIRIMKTISQDTARTCMMCGKSGSRRKEQYGQPPLCRPHYLEYINAISED